MRSFDIPLEYREKTDEDWEQIFNILSIRNVEQNPLSGMNRTSFVLSKNRYNLTAIKILLKWGCDPSNALRGASSCGSPELVQLFLNDPRIDPKSGRDNEGARGALEAATMSNRVDNMKVLLADKRVQDVASENNNSIIERIIELSTIYHGHTEVFECILDHIIEHKIGDLNFWVTIGANHAAEYGSVEVLDLLVERDLLNPTTTMIDMAARDNQLDSMIILLDRIKYLASQGRDTVSLPSKIEFIEQMSIEGAYYIVKMLLEDQSITGADIGRVMKKIVSTPGRRGTGKTLDVLKVMLNDPRIDQAQDVITNILSSETVPLVFREYILNRNIPKR